MKAIKMKTKLILLAGILLVISGITHASQLIVYQPEGHVIGAALFGVIYFLIGISIIRKRSLMMFWLATVILTIGMILGSYRFLFIQTNPFFVFHLVIDLIVVPICIYTIFSISKKNHISQKV